MQQLAGKLLQRQNFHQCWRWLTNIKFLFWFQALRRGNRAAQQKVKFIMSCLSQRFVSFSNIRSKGLGNIVVQLFKRTTYRLKNTFRRFVISCSVQSVAALDHMSSHIGLAPALVSIVLDHLANSKLGRATRAAEKQNNVAAQRRRDRATFISNPCAQKLRQVQGASDQSKRLTEYRVK